MYRNLTFDLVNSHEELASGSGFIYHSDGYVLTNFHVIAEFSEIAVYVWKDSISAPVVYPAKLLGSDAEADLAVLKIDGGPFDYLPLTNYATPRAGDTVLALGFPGNNDGQPRSLTVTQGSVSSTYTARSIDFIRHHAETQPGNSGGPVITLDGRIVGISSYRIVSFFEGSEGDHLAVSIKEVVDRLQQLEDGTLLARPAIVTSDIYGYRIALPALWEVLDEHDLGFKARGPSGSQITVRLTRELPAGVDPETWLHEQDADFYAGLPDATVGLSSVESTFSGLVLSSTASGTRDGPLYLIQRYQFINSSMAIEIVFEGRLHIRIWNEISEAIGVIVGSGWTRLLSQTQLSSIRGVTTSLEGLWTVPVLYYTFGNSPGGERYFAVHPDSFLSRVVMVRLRFARDEDGPVSFRAGWQAARIVLADGTVLHALDPAAASTQIDPSGASERFEAMLPFAIEAQGFGYSVTALTEDGYTADFLFELPIGVEIAEVHWLGSAGYHRFEVEQQYQSPAFITPPFPALLSS